MSDEELRLYGMDGWEHLYTDLQSAIEFHIDDLYEVPITDTVFVFEEYDTEPTSKHMPDVDRLLEWIHEHICEYDDCGDEWFHEHVEKACHNDEVVLKMQHVLDLIASKITYRMAGKMLRQIKVKITDVREHGIVDWVEIDE